MRLKHLIDSTGEPIAVFAEGDHNAGEFIHAIVMQDVDGIAHEEFWPDGTGMCSVEDVRQEFWKWEEAAGPEEYDQKIIRDVGENDPDSFYVTFIWFG